MFGLHCDPIGVDRSGNYKEKKKKKQIIINNTEFLVCDNFIELGENIMLLSLTVYP